METSKQKTNLSLVFLFVGLLMGACSKQNSFDYISEPGSTTEAVEDDPASEDHPPVSEVPEPSPEPLPDEPEPPKESLREVIPLWEGKVSGGKEWTAHVDRQLEVLGEDLLDVIPKDRGLFCPKYDKLTYFQRKQYWAFMISAMVRFESNFKTNTKYTESFNDSNGRRVISRGLMQLSIESGNAYGCGFKSSQDLHDPYKNLSCGIRILNRWLERDGRIAGKVSGKWRGGARYWSVLRAGNKTSYKSILQWSQKLPFCK